MSKVLSASEQSAAAGWVARHWVTLSAVTGGMVGVWWLLGSYGYGLSGRAWLGLIAGIFVLRHLAGIGVWRYRRRRQLAKAHLPAPGFRALLGQWWLERRRVAYIRKQWQAVCQVHGIVGLGKVVPKLHKIRSTVEGDLTCLVSPGPIGVKGGVDKISANAPMIAETCGCLELLVKRTGVGHAVLTFLWTEQFERVIPVAELPLNVPKGHVPFGVRRDGSPATLKLPQSALISGMKGGGKSGITWSFLAGLIALDIKTDLYASDPKGGIEMGVLRDKVGDRHPDRPLRVVDYASDVEGTIRLIDKFERAMKDRATLTDNRQWTVDDAAAFPLGLLVFDECIEVMQHLLSGAANSPGRKAYQKLKIIESQGRALGFMVLYLSQLAQKDLLGAIRDMTPQQLSLKQKNSINTDMVLGDGAEKMGALCSKIGDRPGFGYQADETMRGFVPFRATWCNDADLRRIADSLLPEGVGGGPRIPVDRQCAVYAFFTADDQSVYVGLSVDPTRRRDEHAGVGGKPKWWWPHVDESRTRIMWCDSEADARVLEERLIRKYRPVGNSQHNGGNPAAGRTPLPLPGGHKPKPRKPARDVAAAVPVSDPQPVLHSGNVTPLRSRPRAAGVTTSRRRRPA